VTHRAQSPLPPRDSVTAVGRLRTARTPRAGRSTPRRRAVRGRRPSVPCRLPSGL